MATMEKNLRFFMMLIVNQFTQLVVRMGSGICKRIVSRGQKLLTSARIRLCGLDLLIRESLYHLQSDKRDQNPKHAGSDVYHRRMLKTLGVLSKSRCQAVGDAITDSADDPKRPPDSHDIAWAS